MNFTVSPFRSNPVMAFRRAGYRFQHHVESQPGKMSFVREMGRNGYPRYHAYAQMKGTNLNVSIHIDHTKHTHGDVTRHHGEYDDTGALGPEVARLQSILH